MRDEEKHLGKPLRLSEAITELGFDPDVRKFRRRLLAVERHTGKRIMTRLGPREGTDGRVTYLVTMRMLRRHFPEWFTDEIERAQRRQRDAAAERLQKKLGDIEESISEHADAWAKVAEITRGLGERLRKLEAHWYANAPVPKTNRIVPRKAT